jgi:hypothetical protein
VLTSLAPCASAQIQSWDKQIAGGRFKILGPFNNEAVLDQETGLVWERQPSALKARWSPYGFDEFPATAHIFCNVKTIGKRLGWRLPTIQELASIMDPSQRTPSLPPGHPFILTAEQNAGQFWSSSISATDPLTSPHSAWMVDLSVLPADDNVLEADMTDPRYYWCVRGGSGTDSQ